MASAAAARRARLIIPTDQPARTTYSRRDTPTIFRTDAIDKSSAAGRRGQPRLSAAQFHKPGKGRRVASPVAADGDCRFVAAALPFMSDARRDPPDCRVVKQKRLNHCLDKLDQAVAAADVRQFVGQHGLQLCWRQPG
jgi:hypothetical protein